MQPHLLMSPRLAQPFGRVAPGIICCENDETGEKYYTGVSFKEGWKCPEGWHRSDGCTEFPPPPEQRVRGPQVPPLLPSASPIPTGRRPTPRPAVPTPPTAVPHAKKQNVPLGLSVESTHRSNPGGCWGVDRARQTRAASVCKFGSKLLKIKRSSGN